MICLSYLKNVTLVQVIDYCGGKIVDKPSLIAEALNKGGIGTIEDVSEVKLDEATEKACEGYKAVTFSPRLNKIRFESL